MRAIGLRLSELYKLHPEDAVTISRLCKLVGVSYPYWRSRLMKLAFRPLGTRRWYVKVKDAIAFFEGQIPEKEGE